MDAKNNIGAALIASPSCQLNSQDRKILQDAVDTLKECGSRMEGMERTVVFHVGARLRDYLQRVGGEPRLAAEANRTKEAPRFSIDADILDNLVVGIVSEGQFLADPATIDRTRHPGVSSQRIDALPRLNEIFREEGRNACLAAICVEEDRLVLGEADPAKRFSATWDASFGAVGTETLPVTAFGQANGYSAEDLVAINALEVGQTWKDGAYGEAHTVTRLEDLQLTVDHELDEAPDQRQSRSRMRM